MNIPGSRYFEIKPSETTEWNRFLMRKQKIEADSGPYQVPHLRAFFDHPVLAKEIKRLLYVNPFSLDTFQANWNRIVAIFCFISGRKFSTSPVRRVINVSGGNAPRLNYISSSEPTVEEGYSSLPLPELRSQLDIKFLASKSSKKEYSGSRPIGEGGFSRVFMLKSAELKRRVAVKKIKIESRSEKKILAEIACYKDLVHPNIVKVYHTRQTEAEYWIVMECLEGGNLFVARRLYKFQEQHVGFFAREILKGLDYIHERLVVHRDITTNNIMLSSVDGQIRIIDFGLSLKLPSEAPISAKMSGTPIAMPPEVIRESKVGLPCDIWGLGMLLLELVSGKGTIPDGYSCMFSACFNRPGMPIPDQNSGYTPAFRDFISKALTPNPDQRPSAKQLLSHQWLQTTDIPDNMKSIFMQIFVQNALVTYGF